MAAPSPTVKKLSEIKSALLRPALTSHFICEFRPPEEFLNSKFTKDRIESGFIGVDYSANQELITLSCTDASLPGSSLATIDIENDYHGVSEKHAYRRLYDDRADFTFYVDSDYKIIHFFENWLSYCVGEDDISRQKVTDYSYRVNYPKSYKTESLYITKFERSENKSGRVLQYKFVNAYPISINSMPVSYDTSQLLKCTVSFYYSRYIVTPNRDDYKLTSSQRNPNNPGNPESNFSNGVLLNQRLLTDSGRFERIPSAGILDVGITNVG
jgi:hypothetical protein